MLTDRLANLLGATSLLISDLMIKEIKTREGLENNAIAALVLIGHEPGKPIGFISGVLALSHSGAVRLVDNLIQRKLVYKEAGKDKREAHLFLSPEGEQLRDKILDMRIDLIKNTLSSFSEAEQRKMSQLLSKVLSANVNEENQAYRICRLCDEQRCLQPNCPVEDAFS